ncbi:MAG: LTA synthase family protein [Gammaproteobacteria bacterium]|nr:LTA synthase family protein [Gammaproteobacteria bacterium]
MLLRLSEKLGPLGPIFIFYLLSLYGFFINRIALAVYYWDNTLQIDNIFELFVVGVRTDLIILCLVAAIPTLVLFIFNNPHKSIIRWSLSLYFTVFALFFLVSEISSWPFMAEFNSRPNQLLFKYFTHPKEVLLMVWAENTWLIIFTIALCIVLFRAGWALFEASIESIDQWKLRRRLLVLPIVVVLLTLGARSGIGQATANPGIAAFSNNFVSNQIALNASYSVVHALYRTETESMDEALKFGKLPDEEIVKRVKKYMVADDKDFVNDYSTQHKVSGKTLATPKNLVIILIEGLSAKYTGFLGGTKLTPNLDKISRESLIFPNTYAIGTRTDRGIQALSTGLPPSPGYSSILRTDEAQHGFFTVSNMLKSMGYNTMFIYGGEKHFDNMSSFFLGNGTKLAVGVEDYVNPVFMGTWGVSDEDTLNMALQKIRDSKQPFSTFIMTLSNHKPHDFPQGRITPEQGRLNRVENTVKYTDYAIGEFFKKIRQEPFFKDTMFVISADHAYKVATVNPVPDNEFRIPAIIYNSGEAPRTIDTMASQLDLLPTAAYLLGFSGVDPMIGKNLLQPVPPEKQCAIMIAYDTIIFRTLNKAVTYQRDHPPTTYQLEQQQWVSVADDQELIQDGMAHFLLPTYVVKKDAYKSMP